MADSHRQGFSHLQAPAGHSVQQAWGLQQMQSGHLQAAPHWQAAPQGQGQAAFFAAAAHWHGASHLQAGWQGQDFGASASAAAPISDATRIKCANMYMSP